MATLRLVTVLVTFAALIMSIAMASNLRNGVQVPVAPSQSGSDDTATTSVSIDSSRIVETESSVQDDSVQTDGVKAWAQCGGLYYLGETKCTQHTFCKQLSDFISVCFPESRPTEKVIRLEL